MRPSWRNRGRSAGSNTWTVPRIVQVFTNLSGSTGPTVRMVRAWRAADRNCAWTPHRSRHTVSWSAGAVRCWPYKMRALRSSSSISQLVPPLCGPTPFQTAGSLQSRSWRCINKGFPPAMPPQSRPLALRGEEAQRSKRGFAVGGNERYRACADDAPLGPVSEQSSNRDRGTPPAGGGRSAGVTFVTRQKSPKARLRAGRP